mgnify:CR=1 FL=1
MSDKLQKIMWGLLTLGFVWVFLFSDDMGFFNFGDVFGLTEWVE